MLIGIDPKVDYAFKRVLGDERNADILIHLLNAILAPGRPIVSVEILNPFQEKDFSEDKLSILDIKARDDLGRLVHVEMQLLLPRHFRGRILYYWASLYRQQIGEGDAYDRLHPTISICFVNQTLFSEANDYHLAFGLLSREHAVCFSDHLQLHVLELPKFALSLAELRTPKEKWLYFLRHAATLDADSLPRALDEPVYRKAAQEFAMLTKEAVERERYEARQKAIRDQMSLLQEAREDGREEGRQEGRQEGVQQGELIGRLQVCQRFLRRHVTPRDELERLSLEELRQRVDALEAEMFAS